MRPDDTLDCDRTRALIVMVMIATTALLALTFHQRNLTARKHLNDDDLVFYYNALSIDAPERFASLNAQVSEHLSHQPINSNCHCLWEKYRFDLREQFRNNYRLYHYAVNIVHRLIQPFAQNFGSDYANFIGATMLASYYLCFAAALGFLFVIVVGFVGFDLVIALALGVVAMQVVSDVSPYHPAFWQLRVRPAALWDWLSWGRTVSFLLVSPSTSIIDWFPRPLSMLMAIAVFLLRWTGRPALAYAVVALVIAVHQGNGSLLLFTLLAGDVVFHKARFRQVGVLIGVGCGLAALTLPNGLLGDASGVSWQAVPIAVALLAALLIVSFLLPQASWWPLVSVERWRTAIGQHQRIAIDLFAIGILWFAWSALSLIMYVRVGLPNGAYTWGDLPARYLMLFRGPVFVGLVAIVGDTVRKWLGPEVRAGVAVAACLAMLAVELPIIGADKMADVARSLRPLESQLQAAVAGSPQPYSEALTYYAISKSIETGSNFVTPLLREVESR
jgi:hypothetical protein